MFNNKMKIYSLWFYLPWKKKHWLGRLKNTKYWPYKYDSPAYQTAANFISYFQTTRTKSFKIVLLSSFIYRPSTISPFLFYHFLPNTLKTTDNIDLLFFNITSWQAIKQLDFYNNRRFYPFYSFQLNHEIRWIMVIWKQNNSFNLLIENKPFNHSKPHWSLKYRTSTIISYFILNNLHASILAKIFVKIRNTSNKMK